MKRCIYEKVYLLVAFLIIFTFITSQSKSQIQGPCNNDCPNIEWSNLISLDIELGEIIFQEPYYGVPLTPCTCSITVLYKLRHGYFAPDSIWDIEIAYIYTHDDCLSIVGCTPGEMMKSIAKILLMKAWIGALFSNYNGAWGDPEYGDITPGGDEIRIYLPACWQKTYQNKRYIPCDTTQCCIRGYTGFSPAKDHSYPQIYQGYGFNDNITIDNVTYYESAESCSEGVPEGCQFLCDDVVLNRGTPLGYFNNFLYMISSVTENSIIKSTFTIFVDNLSNSLIIKQNVPIENSNQYNIKVFDFLGRLVISKNDLILQYGLNNIGTPNLENGVYIIQLLGNNLLISNSIILIH